AIVRAFNQVFPCKTTASPIKGIQAPASPPLSSLQWLRSFQSPAPPTQYNVRLVAVGVLIIKPVLPSLSIPFTVNGTTLPVTAILLSNTLSMSASAPAAKLIVPL